MQKKRNTKKLVLILTSVLLAIAIAGGCLFFFVGRSTEPVDVFPFYYFGMTEYWGDALESYGPVTTDRIQTVFLSPTQTVTEIMVNQGDTVKKGDVLMTFDTTLTDIALERERLKIEKLKLDQKDAWAYLYQINSMVPMAPPSDPGVEDTEPEDMGIGLAAPYQFSAQTAFNGTTEDLAIICWLGSDTKIDEALFQAVYLQAEAYRAETPAQPEAPQTEDVEEELPTEPEEGPYDPNTVYVVFKVTEDNMSLGQTLIWQGVVLTRDPANGSFRFQFYDASGFDDHMIPQTPETDLPEENLNSGFTAAQIAEMRNQQEKLIRDLDFQIKMAEADYQIMLTEMGDGNVYADFDGTVVSLISPEEAQMTQQPMMKVSGGGGFYVSGTVGELDMDKLTIGQEVTINDWNTGMTYVGTVQSVGDYPVTNDYFTGIGNPNVSYYPFTVFVDGSADLQAGSYVSIQYSISSMESGVYLDNSFLRTENGQSYIYVRDENGLLEKRYVTVGKSLWGSYTQILTGLTAEDYIAFPYGKHVKPGAETVESDPSALYGY